MKNRYYLVASAVIALIVTLVSPSETFGSFIGLNVRWFFNLIGANAIFFETKKRTTYIPKAYYFIFIIILLGVGINVDAELETETLTESMVRYSLLLLECSIWFIGIDKFIRSFSKKKTQTIIKS
ncbi:hypothetical protein [Flammeovirga aprica]|uniref:Uncharacterized protein n=1 Tax=Flammeovirga aprica JL-4 TaxID=694437 RepID=A0A7X9RXK1_9BACT|nr:hypothetical protein [Flammeovirga aprica]NME70575.1 hypothetical protein [Flammeovirga aprica JL-4]